MDRTREVTRFLYSHHFHSGVRQSIGVLVPPFLLVGALDQPVIGMAAAFGALCVSIIDQPGPNQHRLNSMAGCALLGTLVTLITGLATAWPPLLIAVVILQTFGLGLLSVFGLKGNMVGFACLLLMTLTLHHAVPPEAAVTQALASLGGGLWYIAFSLTINWLLNLRQERQTLAVALFATARYMAAKARFYDIDQPLDQCYRALLPRQSELADRQQAARDMILRIAPRGPGGHARAERIMLANLFVDMVDLQQTLLATHSDYEVLRGALGDSDILRFGRDALLKLARELDDIGMAVVRPHPLERTTSIRAELRAIEYDMVHARRRGFPEQHPEAWIVLVQIVRRLRTADRLVARMREHLRRGGAGDELLLENHGSLRPFLSRSDVSLGRLAGHFHLGSPHLRYAIRLAVAVGAGLALAHLMAELGQRFTSGVIGQHGYWIVLTIVVIMRPGFVMSSQRNRWRLVGTLIGCALTVGVMQLTQSAPLLLSLMLVAAIISNSLVLLNQLTSALFNTMFVLLSFHFLSPGSLTVVGERALDAVLGSILVWACSYVLPYWERRSLLPQASATLAANQQLVSLCRAAAIQPQGPSAIDGLEWRLARRNVHATFANFADGFYRMTREPRSKRLPVLPLNELLLQNHALAAQVLTLGPLLHQRDPQRPPPAALLDLLDAMVESLGTLRQQVEQALLPTPTPQPPLRLDVEVLHEIHRALQPDAGNPAHGTEDDPAAGTFDPAQLTYELRQMIRSIQRIQEATSRLRADMRQNAFPQLPAPDQASAKASS